MPNLPRIPRTVRRRHRAPQRPVERSEPRIAEIEAAGLRWLQLEEPTAVETAWLAQNFEFHELDLEDVLSTRQRPKIDEYDDYMFIVLHVPHYNKERARLDAAELNVFIGHDYIVTLPNVPLKPLGRLFAQLEDNQERREEYFGKGSGYVLYEILSELFDYCFPILDKIGFKLDRMREAIFTERRSEDVVRDISDVKHEIVSYRKVIKPERSTLRLLERDALPARRPRGLLRRHRRQGRAHLGPARQLQGGRRGARADQRVGHRPQAERHPAAADDLLGHPAAADAHQRASSA